MRYLRKLALLVVIVLIMSLCSVPAFATDTGMQIQVSGGNGDRKSTRLNSSHIH